jgi:NADH-quinone oxidoreductase subunit H
MSLPITFAEVGFAEPWWIQILKAVVIFLVGFTLVPLSLMLDRKLMGRMQMRYGPNRVGPFGALQPMADIGKLLFKQQFRPRTSVGFLFAIAPAISMVCAAASLAIIPFGDTVHIFGEKVGLYGIDVPIGILYLFAFSALSVYGLMLGGWASGSKYSFLGAMRSAAQLISYEVSMGLSLIGVVITAGTLSLTGIVEAQGGMWYIVPQFVGFVIFLLAAFAETNRPPFDLTEADAELVGGYSTEYGGGRFAAYYAAEYFNLVIASAVAVTMFFGGWMLPFGIHPPQWVDPIVVLVKTILVVCFFIWARTTFPRPRYDQLMSLGWKILLPLATANALVTAIIVVVTH